MASTVSRKKSVAMLPKPRPNPLPVCLWKVQLDQGLAREECESPLTMHRRYSIQLALYFEQKHEPMALSLIAVFAYYASQMQVGSRKPQSEFLFGLTTSAGVRGLANIRVQLSPTGTPESEIRLLRPFQEQHLIKVIEAIE